MRYARLALCCLPFSLVLAATWTSQACRPTGQATTATIEPALIADQPPASRRDLAVAYIRFDEAFMLHPPAPGRVADINRAFDRATLRFFSGDLGSVVRAVNELTVSILADAGPPPPESDPKRDPRCEELDTDIRKLRALVADRTGVEPGNTGMDEGDSRRLRVPWTIFRARLMLLEDDPTDSESARFLADRSALVRDLESEFDVLAGGSNPYRRRPGELWRPIVLDGATVPCWVYAPVVVSGEGPRPLVVTLHGAGGDEAMFMRAYGAGQIRRLADEHGFVVASPLTYPLMGNASCLDALIDQVSDDYEIDARRIHILGHSMGGAAVGMLASERSERLASAAMLCGGVGFNRRRPPCPTLIVAGEIDPITSAAGLLAIHDRAERAGLPVEFRRYDGYGHTLTVNAALPETVRWLLDRPRSSE